MLSRVSFRFEERREHRGDAEEGGHGSPPSELESAAAPEAKCAQQVQVATERAVQLVVEVVGRVDHGREERCYIGQREDLTEDDDLERVARGIARKLLP